MLPTIQKILFPTDLSEHARYAFQYAALMANRFDAKLSLMHVIEGIPATGRSLLLDYIGQDKWDELHREKAAGFQEKVRTQMEAFCEEAATEMKDCQFLVENTIVREGYPAEEILREVENNRYDMVVMGSHGQGFMADAFMGNIARRVVRRCKTPVTVIRLPDEK